MVEYHSCTEGQLDDPEFIRAHMCEAALISGATIVEQVFHHFSPHGVSGVVVIAESHMTIHTWPEYGYAAVDLFTCGDEVDPWKGFEYLKEKLGSQNVSMTELKRGLIPGDDVRHKPEGY